MKLIKQIYRDKDGIEWTVQRQSLPKKKGDFVFWTAEAGDKSYRADNKKNLFAQIKNKQP